MLRELTVTVVSGVLVVACGGSKHSSGRGTTSSTRSATTVATPTTPTTAPAITYHVKRGDTLTAIANHFGIPVSVIVSLNHVTNPDRLTEGQTLTIPPAPPLELVVTPTKGEPGQAFELKFTGVKPSEVVTFEIDSPSGKYKGHPHTASTAGIVSATYQTAPTDQPGNYTVIATGNRGSTARTAFVVVPSPTGGT